MRFAEVSQEILVKPTPVKTEPPVGLTPGRRRLNMVSKLYNEYFLHKKNYALMLKNLILMFTVTA